MRRYMARVLSYRPWISALLLRGSGLALLWWALSGSGRALGGFGGIVVLAAATLSLYLSPPQARAPLAWMRFLPRFLWLSFISGIDVARRAFQSRDKLNPELIPYPLSLPEGPARILLMGVLNLLPGTLSVRVFGDTLWVHALVNGPHIIEELHELEGRIAELFTRRPAIPPG